MKLAQSFGVKRLCHFTRLENLKSIVRNGIIPRAKLQKSGSVLFNDDYRLDQFLEASSFSISFPNYRLFYHYRNQKFPNTKWAVIEVLPELMWTQKSLFSLSNAASSTSRQVDPRQRATPVAFESMFADFKEEKDGKSFTVKRQSLNIPPYYTTNPQAEVLVFGKVSPRLISKIFFETTNDRDWVQVHCQPPTHVKLEVERSLFNYRSDYAAWADIKSTDRSGHTYASDDEIPF